jgi:hypothetical protein
MRRVVFSFTIYRVPFLRRWGMLASFFAGAGEGEITINLYMLFLITRILCNFCAQ